MLTEKQIIDKLKVSGALLQGHFKLPSGLHTDQYIECARVLQYPWHATALCGELAERFRKNGTKIELILGPALGGIVVAFGIGKILEHPTVFSERSNGIMTLKRGFSIRPGQRVLIAEDEIVTRKSLDEVINLVEERGGDIVGIAALLDRSGGRTQKIKYPVETLIELEAKMYSPEECPLCKQDLPISTIKSRGQVP